MTAIERLMREWLASDDPAKRLHAEARLKLPFDETTPTPSEPQTGCCGGDAPRLPGLATLAANAAVAVATHVAHGMPSAPDDVHEARLKACETCPNLILPDWRCGGMGGCGCYLKTKARWAEQVCPLGKWVGT